LLETVLFCVLLPGCSESPNDDSAGPAGAGGSVSAGGAGGDGASGGAGGEIDPGPPPAGDTCDAPVDVNAVATKEADGTLVVTGTNVAARTDLEACDPTSDPVSDVFYRYTASVTGRLQWLLEPSTPTRFLMDVRTSCTDTSSSQSCDDCFPQCFGERDVTEGDTLFFAISGIRTTNSPDGTGDFALSLLLLPKPSLGDACVSPNAGGLPCPDGTECQEASGRTPICGVPACGDGFLGFTPFECEDGNTASNDGCSATCQFDAQGAGGVDCDSPVTLNLPRIRGVANEAVLRMAIASGDFVAGSDLSASCAAGAGPEAVYVFELAEPSSIKVTAGNAEVLSVRRAPLTDCGSEEIACTAGPASDALTLDLGLVEPGRYAILLDREEPTTAATPTYSIDVVATPPP
jgi:cysteine-rich repeat protein